MYPRVKCRTNTTERRDLGWPFGRDAEKPAFLRKGNFKSVDVLDLMRTRRSVRAYLDRPVPKPAIERILEAGRWAPSAHNRQPWRFLVIDNSNERETLAAAMGERLAHDRRTSGDAEPDIERDVARSRARITGAPLLILVCMTLEDMDSYPDVRRSAAEKTMAIQSTAMCVQNMLLVVTAEGLAACWMCAPLFCPAVVSRVCRLPALWKPQALITIGYQAAAGKERSRRSISELVL